MDINMPRCDGLLATRLLKRELPATTVVVLTVSGEAEDLFEAIRSGAQGYLLKSLDPESWLECLRGLAGGEAMPRDLARRILAEFAAGAAPADPEACLTEREREILDLVASAMTNRQIAAALYISEQTVKNHVKKVMQKLHLKNRVELALHAQRLATGAGG
jgi:two-component system, NarL family, nitrate/nitrite response regulator NarL